LQEQVVKVDELSPEVEHQQFKGAIIVNVGGSVVVFTGVSGLEDSIDHAL